MNRTWLPMVMLIFFTASSCRKEQIMKIAEVTDLKLSKITEIHADGSSTITSFFYDEQKRLSTVQKGEDSTIYTYSGSRIINVEVQDGKTTTSTSINYKDSIPYDGISKIYYSGYLIKTLDCRFACNLSETAQVNFYDNGNTYRKIYFGYENGNITESQVLQNRILTFYDFVYGERKNILFNANTRWGFGLGDIDRVSTNEVLKIITEVGSRKHIKKFSYTYNEEGLPTSALITETDPPFTFQTQTLVTYTYIRL